MGVKLYPQQEEALGRMRNGVILNGAVGSGKSITSLAYYFTKVCRGNLEKLTIQRPVDLYIITTAMKRDRYEWDDECARFLLSTDPAKCFHGVKVVIDSWNKITNYTDVQGAFFIFDEQRVSGHGAWVKSFLKIARRNLWILLSGTPGDCFMDYVPVFIANGYFKNRTEFTRRHVVYKKWVKYPAVDRYLDERRLMKMRDSVLVDMNVIRHTIPHHINVLVPYDTALYKSVMKDRWNFLATPQRPIETASELCYILRRVVNGDDRRLREVEKILKDHPKAIIFFNFTYEVEMLTLMCEAAGMPVARWDGKKHEPLPTGDHWVYLVQYAAGDSGWNCTTTDTIIFYSQNYSYKSTVQAAGRIDRVNSPYTDLYYYHLRSAANIDLAIYRALRKKKKFNETRYVSHCK